MPNNLFRTLHARLGAVVVSALLPVLGLTLYNGLRQYRSDERAAEEMVVRTARRITVAQRESLQTTRQLLLAISKSPAVRDLDAQQSRALLVEEQRQHSPYVNLGVADAQGRVICNSGNGPASVANARWFRGVLKTHNFAVGDYEPDPQTGRVTLTAGYPLLDEQHAVRAVVFETTDLQWTEQMAETMKLPEGSLMTVFNQTGKVLAHWPPHDDKTKPESIEERIWRETAEHTGHFPVHGAARLYGVSPLRRTNTEAASYVAIAIPRHVALGRARQNLIHDVIIWLIAALLMVLCLTITGKRFLMQPVDALVATTKRLARGDLTARVGDCGGGREMEQLARSFNEMAEALARQASELEQSEERFRQVVDTSPMGMHFWRLQPDGQLIFVGANRAADEILHIDHASLIGKPILEAFPAHATNEIPDRYREVCAVGLPWHSEETVYRDDQVEGVFEVFAFRTVPGSMAAMFTDITDRRKALDALRQSEHQFRQLFENSPDAIFVESLDGYVLDVNPAACRLHGTTRDKLIGLHVTDLVPAEYREQVAKDFPKIASGEWSHIEGISQTASERSIPVEINAALIDYNGKPSILLHVRDVTNRKRAEIALLESETRFRHMSEAGFEGIILTDNNRILDANTRLADMLGYRHTDLIGKPLTDLIATESIDAITTQITSDSKKAVEFQARRKDGTAIPVEARSRTMPYKGRPVRVTAMRDLTEQHRAQQTLQRLATAIEQTVEAVVITDPKGDILYVNHSFETVTGYTRDEVTGKNPRILKSGKHDDAFYHELWDTVTRGNVWRGFFYNRRKDGTIYQEEGTISPIKDRNGRITAYVAVKRDVTREVAMEIQLLQSRKMEAIGRLAGGVAHDFNNMLTAITGYSELSLRRVTAADPIHHNIEEVLKAAERATVLTRQLLAFSRKQVLETKLIDINDLVTNVQGMLRRVIGEDIELVIVPEQPAIWPVKADPGQIEQVLLNLVVNGRDAMPLGGKLTLLTANVTVDDAFARQHVGLTTGDYILLSVTDTGVGMTDEVKAHLFEPFFTTKAADKGTGLGLATSYGIIKQSGGHIVVSSRPGSGSSFDVYLPRADGTGTTRSRASAAPPDEVPRSRGNETILFAEDEETVRELTQMVLRELGYNVLTATNGAEAIQLAHQHADQKISLLLTDVIMPKMGGRELAERMRQQDPKLKVLFCTGYTAETEWINSSLSKISFYLPKPFAPTALARKVREALDA